MVEDNLPQLRVAFDCVAQNVLRFTHSLQSAEFHSHCHAQMAEVRPAISGKLVDRQSRFMAFGLAKGLGEVEDMEGFIGLNLR